ncbi:MAG: lysophospholipase [Alphaproteobacteria bacterium]
MSAVRSALHKARRQTRAASWVVGICMMALGACAPRIAPMGAAPQAPTLAEDHIQTADGIRLPLRYWPAKDSAPRAVILALHGFNDYSKSFENPAAAWNEAGISVYAYDQRGFGDAPHRGMWGGIEAMTGDLIVTSRLLRRRHPGTPLYLLGESMGGAVILAAYADGGGGRPEADGVVLSAPAVWSRNHMPVYQRAALWLGAHTTPWLTLSGRGLKIKPSDNIEMLRALGRDPRVIKATRIDALWGLTDLMDRALAAAPALDTRALILYGKTEDLIPDAAQRDLLAVLPDTGLWRHTEYATGYHMLLRDLNAAVVLRDITDWALAAPEAPVEDGTAIAERPGGAARR